MIRHARARSAFLVTVLVTAWVAVGVVVAPAARATAPSSGPASTFTPLGPTRVLDSRDGTGTPVARWGAGESRDVVVAGVVGVPPDATAVVVNVVAVAPSAATHLTVWPAGAAVPLASTVNVPAGDTRANQVTVPVGAGGAVSILNHAGTVDVVADLAGWYGPSGSSVLTPTSPTRVLDSRVGTGTSEGRWGPGESRDVVVAGVPAGASAVVVNLVAVAPSAATHLVVWPAGAAVPLASTVNVPAGDTRANQVVVPVGDGGAVSISNHTGAVDVVADVAGWYGPTAGAPGSGRFRPTGPTRVLDSRDGTGGYATPWFPGVARDVAVAGVGGVPADAAAVVVNLVAVAPSAATHLVVWPAGAAVPLASTVNVPAGDTRANQVVVPVDATGRVSVVNNAGLVHVVADVAGWFTGTAVDPCAAVGTEVRTGQRYRAPATLPPGTDPDLVSVDVYAPVRPAGCPPAPAVVWVHGGGWQGGDKTNQLRDKVAWARAHGWVLVSANYRLAPAVTYPTFNDDVGAAVDWVLDHAGDLGVDPARMALMGHSAGAGIVAAVSTDERHLQRSGRDLADIACTASLDTEGYDVAQEGGQGNPIYLQAFGTDPATWAEASPINHIEAGHDIPAHLVVTRGTLVRKQLSARYAADLRAAGVPATLLDASPLSHEGVNDAVGHPGDPIVTPALDAFLGACLV